MCCVCMFGVGFGALPRFRLGAKQRSAAPWRAFRAMAACRRSSFASLPARAGGPAPATRAGADPSSPSGPAGFRAWSQRTHAWDVSPGILNAQWHYYNQGAVAEKDASLIQVCTVPRALRKNIASLTFLGTENFNGPFGMPAETMSDFGGGCTNNSGAPIHIYGFTPHMHKLGRHIKAQVKRAVTGQLETVFDKAFDFNSQITYILDDLIVLQPGDTIISTCTFLNHTDAPVAFGPSTEEEMCYNFTMSYPARKLDNGTLSLIGATHVCW
jgi:hypothetical protein